MLRETTHCLDQQSRSLNRRDDPIHESQERVTPAPESKSERNRMACAFRSEEGHRSKLD